jgi:hypothetical protein
MQNLKSKKNDVLREGEIIMNSRPGTGRPPDGAPCVIARTVSNSTFLAMHSNLKFLRGFRDKIVLKTIFKIPFEKSLHQYYQFTPFIIRKMETSSKFRKLVKCVVYSFLILAKQTVSLALALMQIQSYAMSD